MFTKSTDMDCTETPYILCINVIKETQMYMEFCLLLTDVLVYSLSIMKQTYNYIGGFTKIESSPMVEFSLHLEGVWDSNANSKTW